MSAWSAAWVPAWLPAAVAIVAMLAAALPGAGELLEFDRERILAGELWRTLTGQSVHWSQRHLLWNVAGAGMLAIWFRKLPPRFWAIAGGAGALAVAVGLLVETPALDEYRGLSGVLYGWLVAALLAGSADRPVSDGHPRAYFIDTRVPHWSLAGAISLWALMDALGVAGGVRQNVGTPPTHGSAHVYGILGACIASWMLYRQTPAISGRNHAGCD